jgi:HlyD family secretion protein
MNDTNNKKSGIGRKNALRKWGFRAIYAIIAVGVIAGVISAFAPKPVIVEAAEVKKGRSTVTVDEDGRTRVKDRYIVSAPLAGDLARITLHPGDKVDAKTVLARLLPLPAPMLDVRSQAEAKARKASADAALKQAQAAQSRSKAALDFAESERENFRKLAQTDSISRQRFERADMEFRTRKEEHTSAIFGVKVALHQVELAKAAMGRLDKNNADTDDMQIQSPIEGVVLEVMRENEGVVQAGAPLVEIGNPTALEIVVDILTMDAVRVQPGAKVNILRWGGNEDLQGHVRRVEPKAFTRFSSLGVEEQRVNIVLDLDSPPEKWVALGDGFRVEASIVVWEDLEAVKLPVSALFKHDDKWSVFVAKDGVAGLRSVEIGQRNGFEAQVVTGLEPGETVILHPGERVSDGSQVEFR